MTDRICDIDGCGRPHSSRGLCSIHAWRRKHGKDLLTPVRGDLRDFPCSIPGCVRFSVYTRMCQPHTNILRQYSITLDQYLTLWKSQDGLCGICRCDKELVIDHDHGCCSGISSCGHCVRGLLCRTCNMNMAVYDDYSFTIKADAYRYKYFSAHGNPNNWSDSLNDFEVTGGTEA